MISVCIATYNGGKYIKEQLESILPQLTNVDEVIISDDNSTDETIEIIKSIKDDRIKIFKNELKSGYSKNFENAINKSSGDIIFICDQDDLWENNKVELMVLGLKKNDLVISDALICDGLLKETLGSHFKVYGTQKGFIPNWIKTRYIGACMAFKREILTKVLPFPENQSLCAYDYWITVVCELYFKVDLVPLPLIRYRRHGNNASTGGEKSSNSTLKKMKTRIYTLYNLLKRM